MRHPVLAGNALTAFAILLSLGYFIYRDQRAEQEKKHEAEAVEEIHKHQLGKAAWDRALKGLASEAEGAVPRGKGEIFSARSVQVKSYANSDITWNNPKAVTVKGYVSISGPVKNIGHPNYEQSAIHQFCWTRELIHLDDDEWGVSKTTLTPCELPKQEAMKMFLITINSQ